MKRGWGARIAALALLSFVGACETVLGFGSYADAVEKLCGCPGFDKLGDTCLPRGHALLAAASDEAVEKWLTHYGERGCDEVCDYADACYNELPGCSDLEVGCECCIWDDKGIQCAPKCQTCRTCSEVVAAPNAPLVDCISARARVRDLKRCACKGSTCESLCTGFCQGVDPITNECQDCLNNLSACKALAAACFEDKPG